MWPLHRDACNMVADFREREGLREREGEKRRRRRMAERGGGRGKEEENPQKPVLCNLFSEVTPHHFLHMLLGHRPTLVHYGKGLHKSPGGGIIGTILEAGYLISCG